ncbi:MBL fold metallo-hydrolase [Peptostreptococcus faecalis]|uniref:MBL fold metallo-hydrolase n=1 Tax=Peptostreptococcus faecalis TaxID=2045015 RepID=UPI000C7970C1|nr:MBL fold metallo-hydrolase [Peptostreptococcus faecalis]
MNLKYIHHSGFLLKMDNCNIIFDYFKGEVEELDKKKRLYVFCSHAHPDHFNENIFNMFRNYDDVFFILSDDIKPSDSENAKLAYYVAPNKKYNIGDINIETFESTDEGVAFLIEVENKVVYHAGDLNWWTWVGFESEEEFDIMTDRFKREIEKIKNKNIDLAMVPLDPRQGERYDWGLSYFLEMTNTKNIVPMHLWNKYNIIDDFVKAHKDLAEKSNIIKTDETVNDGIDI